MSAACIGEGPLQQ